jgi:hypothetical protein
MQGIYLKKQRIKELIETGQKWGVAGTTALF